MLNNKKLFGLIGYPLEHSFSKVFFENKFCSEKMKNVSYENFPIENINLLPILLNKEKNLCGFNVTIPYKVAIIPFLDKISDTAKEAGAVNVVKIDRNKNGISFLTGYNTDILGFEKTLCNSLSGTDLKFKSNYGGTNCKIASAERQKDKITTSALILGTGGAAKTAGYVLKKMNIEYQFVSRHPQNNTLTYEMVNKKMIEDNLLIINTTPLGMFPNINTCPPIDYEAINEKHFLFDLIYNPPETLFLKKGKEHHAFIQNGYAMFCCQAEESWKIWNQKMLFT